MDDWAKMQKYGLQEMKKFQIGTRVKCRMFGGRLKGVVIETEPPSGLFSPRYKCRWDDGIESKFMHSSDLEII